VVAVTRIGQWEIVPDGDSFNVMEHGQRFASYVSQDDAGRIIAGLRALEYLRETHIQEGVNSSGAVAWICSGCRGYSYDGINDEEPDPPANFPHQRNCRIAAILEGLRDPQPTEATRLRAELRRQMRDESKLGHKVAAAEKEIERVRCMLATITASSEAIVEMLAGDPRAMLKVSRPNRGVVSRWVLATIDARDMIDEAQPEPVAADEPCSDDSVRTPHV
jgi:hypothetical protein